LLHLSRALACDVATLKKSRGRRTL